MNQIDINANGQQIDQKKLIENTLIESIKNKENITNFLSFSIIISANL